MNVIGMKESLQLGVLPETLRPTREPSEVHCLFLFGEAVPHLSGSCVVLMAWRHESAAVESLERLCVGVRTNCHIHDLVVSHAVATGCWWMVPGVVNWTKCAGDFPTILSVRAWPVGDVHVVAWCSSSMGVSGLWHNF